YGAIRQVRYIQGDIRLLHHHPRYIDRRINDGIDPNELFRRNTDNREHVAIDSDCTAHDIRCAAEIALPFRVADHRYLIPSGYRVLFREKSATGGRLHLQHRKEISADQHSQRHARLISGVWGESYERHLVRCDATEALAPFHKVAGFRIGKTY